MWGTAGKRPQLRRYTPSIEHRRQRRSSWRSVVETLPGIVFTARPDGSIGFVNRRLSDFAGLTRDQMRGRGWQSFVHPDDVGRVGEAWQHSINTGDELRIELRFRKADGSHAWLSCAAAPLRDRSGTIVRWYGTAMDVDARRRAEEALAYSRLELGDSERRFRVLAEAIPVMCWSADVTGWIDWYNRRWYEFTGQSSEEAVGWGWQAAHHPDDFLEVMHRWPRSIATGEPFEMEFRLRRHDGAFHWFLTRAEPLRDANGTIVRWYGSSVDIHAQKRALERTKRVAETLQEIFLPTVFPARDDVQFDAVYVSAEKDALVGGDWYDAFELPDGRIVFSIGDIAGHGLEASISVGRIRQAIYTLAFENREPSGILAAVDSILAHQDPGRMVTALVGIIDSQERRLTYASAGHPPPLVAFTNDRPAHALPTGGPPLGFAMAADLETHAVELRPDAVIAAYTDGVVESGGDISGAEAKLRAAVALLVRERSVTRPAAALADILLEERAPRDDAALMVMQFCAATAADRAEPPSLGRTWRFHSSDAHSAHASRREITGYLRDQIDDEEALFASELVIGEVLANTVEHAPGLVEVDLEWSEPQPVMTVRDTGPGLRRWTTALPHDSLSEDGRGMFLINALATSLSVRPAPGFGTEMRVVLPLSRERPARRPALEAESVSRLMREGQTRSRS